MRPGGLCGGCYVYRLDTSRYVHRGCAYGEFADDGSDRTEYADVGSGLPMAENPIPWMLTVMMGMSGMDAVKLSTAGGPVIWRL